MVGFRRDGSGPWWWLKACKNCGGDLHREQSVYGDPPPEHWEWCCFMCGRRYFLGGKPKNARPIPLDA